MDQITKIEQIGQIIDELGMPKYRLQQVKDAIYKNKKTLVSSFNNIPVELKQTIAAKLGDDLFSLKKIKAVAGNQVEKLLFETADGHKLESVWMNYYPEFSESRESLCVSSQSGCALGCAFCYTGTMGLKKNLTADEICDQVLYFKNDRDFKGSISFMGMGEPFANIDNVFKAFSYLTDPTMFGIGQRHLNVSTVGLVPGIQRLSKEFPQINLAFSLHTPFEEQRLKLMPITKAYGISQVFDALDAHIEKTHRKVFIAYIFLAGVNDTSEHAYALAKLIKGRGDKAYLYHINLIRFHGEGGGINFKAPHKDAMTTFMSILTEKKINHTLRQSFGLDINAACGQLVV